jgi:hypothetical protein
MKTPAVWHALLEPSPLALGDDMPTRPRQDNDELGDVEPDVSLVPVVPECAGTWPRGR